jgi:shikimate dehydrogenase
MPRLAVLGQPIAHSRSPQMHTAALAELGLAGEWTYEAIEVAPEDFAERVPAMAGEGFVGANVTIPHKVAALELSDAASDVARQIGAANTLSFRDARIDAENTDAEGFLAALPGSARGMRALVLGAGGSARAIVWALVGTGARVAIWNRTPERAGALAGEFGASVAGAEAAGWRLSGDEFDLLVNTTSVGLAGTNPPPTPRRGLGADPEGAVPDLKALPLDADSIQARHVLVDLVYGSAETRLAAAARAAGATVIDGFEVLVHQGAASLRIWTGLDPPVETMRMAARND